MVLYRLFIRTSFYLDGQVRMVLFFRCAFFGRYSFPGAVEDCVATSNDFRVRAPRLAPIAFFDSFPDADVGGAVVFRDRLCAAFFATWVGWFVVVDVEVEFDGEQRDGSYSRLLPRFRYFNVVVDQSVRPSGFAFWRDLCGVRMGFSRPRDQGDGFSPLSVYQVDHVIVGTVRRGAELEADIQDVTINPVDGEDGYRFVAVVPFTPAGRGYCVGAQVSFHARLCDVRFMEDDSSPYEVSRVDVDRLIREVAELLVGCEAAI